MIGLETRKQILQIEGRLPNEIAACIGGGSNAMGIFWDFLEDTEVRLTGIEAGGRGRGRGEHAARFFEGKVGVLHGCKTYLLLSLIHI